MTLIMWLRERQRLSLLERDLIDLRQKFDGDLSEIRKRVGRNTVEFDSKLGDLFFEQMEITTEMAVIRTDRSLRKARDYNIVVPPKNENDGSWVQSSYDGSWYLTDEAQQKLRREIATERDNYYKPAWAWLPIVVSSVSLAVSLLVALLK